MPEQLALAPTCVLPGCKMPSDDPGLPCADCRAVLGLYLAPSTAPKPTADEVVARDEATRAAYRKQHAEVLGEEAVGVRKANQHCWVCEERRVCTRTPALEWECDSCLLIT